MQKDSTTDSLLTHFQLWEQQADQLDQLSRTAPAADSHLFSDNDALTNPAGSIAFTRYVTERACNAVRTLRKLHFLVFSYEPGKISLDYTVMYPLMRSVIEDTATIAWLLSPDDQEERFKRILRTFKTENKYFSTNQTLIAKAAMTKGVSDPPTLQLLEQRITSEHSKVAELIADIAQYVGINADNLAKPVPSSEPIKTVFGNESTQFLAWKLLSDLSHFSFLQLRHMDRPSSGYAGAPHNQVTLIMLSAEVNRGLAEAVELLDKAMAVSTVEQ